MSLPYNASLVRDLKRWTVCSETVRACQQGICNVATDDAGKTQDAAQLRHALRSIGHSRSGRSSHERSCKVSGLEETV